MNWFWVNIPLMVIFSAAVAGTPLWLVFKHPDTGPGPCPRVMRAPAPS
jgi:hypothetical protein